MTKLEVIVGPMFSGKSTELVRRIERYNLIGHKLLIIGNTMDTRSGSWIKTHTNNKKAVFEKVTHLMEIRSFEEYSTANIIVFDEAQFFDDVVGAVREFMYDGKHVLCAGLSGTYQRTPFDNISNLLSLATDVVFLKAICTFSHNERTVCGNDAPFTSKFGGTCDTVEIGDATLYAPRCYEHYDKM